MLNNSIKVGVDDNGWVVCEDLGFVKGKLFKYNFRNKRFIYNSDLCIAHSHYDPSVYSIKNNEYFIMLDYYLSKEKYIFRTIIDVNFSIYNTEIENIKLYNSNPVIGKRYNAIRALTIPESLDKEKKYYNKMEFIVQDGKEFAYSGAIKIIYKDKVGWIRVSGLPEKKIRDGFTLNT